MPSANNVELKISIKIPKTLGARIWLGCKLLRLAAWVLEGPAAIVTVGDTKMNRASRSDVNVAIEIAAAISTVPPLHVTKPTPITVKKSDSIEIARSEKSEDLLRETHWDAKREPVAVCARCHSKDHHVSDCDEAYPLKELSDESIHAKGDPYAEDKMAI